MDASTTIFQQLIAGVETSPTPNHLWLYVLLTFLVMIEGPVTILIGATAASSGFLYPLPVFVAASIGNMMGDTLWYTLGHSGKLEWALRLKFLKLDMERINFLRDALSKHAVKILLIAKLTNGMIVPALIATGLARVPFRRWFPFIFVANLFTTGAFVALGYFTAVSLSSVNHWIRYVALGFSLLFIVFLSFAIQRSFAKRFSVEKLLAQEGERSG